jgi:uncharacterized short protein YbdD (DUF466 family)
VRQLIPKTECSTEGFIGGPAWNTFMTELREAHRGVPAKSRRVSFAERLQRAYDTAIAKLGKENRR